MLFKVRFETGVNRKKILLVEASDFETVRKKFTSELGDSLISIEALIKEKSILAVKSN